MVEEGEREGQYQSCIASEKLSEVHEVGLHNLLKNKTTIYAVADLCSELNTIQDQIKLDDLKFDGQLNVVEKNILRFIQSETINIISAHNDSLRKIMKTSKTSIMLIRFTSRTASR